MGLLEMFIGGMVGGYLNAKEEENELRKEQERWEKIEPIFDDMYDREFILINVDDLLETINIEIKYFCIDPAEAYVMPIILPLFDINPKNYQIQFLNSLIEQHPFIYTNPSCEIFKIKSYNDCFKNNELVKGIGEIGVPNLDSYIWDKIFSEKEPYKIDLLKDFLSEVSWKFYNLNDTNMPSVYSPSAKYPDNPLLESYLSLIDLNYQLYKLNNP